MTYVETTIEALRGVLGLNDGTDEHCDAIRTVAAAALKEVR